LLLQYLSSHGGKTVMDTTTAETVADQEQLVLQHAFNAGHALSLRE
jgi:hypothetical protein